VNGVVRTLETTRRELENRAHEVVVIQPGEFRTLPCPTYPEIRLALFAGRGVRKRIEASAPEAIHIATEGPLGMAARRACLRLGLKFTTSFHTKFPEYIRARIGLAPGLGYAWLRRFHHSAEAVMAGTSAVKAELEARGFRRVVLWSRGVDTDFFSPGARDFLALPRPIFLYVGRVAVEKNIEAFLSLDLPGSKCVVGDGPMLDRLRARYRDVHFAGLQTTLLPRYYRAADVCVFPSRTDTFGLVLAEAMACGTPVAAFPVQGPIDVVGSSSAGVLDENLRDACLRALTLSRVEARQHAEQFSWSAATDQFFGHLVACRAAACTEEEDQSPSTLMTRRL
jgi:glycosyltransferase involved in cell wall biosynthesis